MYECSEKLDQLNKAFVAARLEIINPYKDGDGANNRYKYAQLVDVQAAIYPACLKHGIAVKQWIYSDHSGKYRVMTMIHHAASDQWERSSVIIEPEMNQSPSVTDRDGNKRSVNTGIQQMGGSISYWKRYCLMALFGLTGSDDDNDGSTSTASYGSNKNEEFTQWVSKDQVATIKKAIDGDNKLYEYLKKCFFVQWVTQIPSNRFDEVLQKIDEFKKGLK